MRALSKGIFIHFHIFTSSKQMWLTDVREEKLSPHNTLITCSMLKFLEARKLLSDPWYFVIVSFTNTKLFAVMTVYFINIFSTFFKKKKTQAKEKNISTANMMLFFFLSFSRSTYYLILKYLKYLQRKNKELCILLPYKKKLHFLYLFMDSI